MDKILCFNSQHRHRLDPIFVVLPLFTCVILTGCAIYRLPVQQGQVLSRIRFNQLEQGMNKATVESIVGAPLLKSPWYPNIWIYVSSYKPAYGITRSWHICLHFTSKGYPHYLCRHTNGSGKIPFGHVPYRLGEPDE